MKEELSLLLVSSPAFCGWGFLNGSKTESEVLIPSELDSSKETNESLNLNTEEVKNLEEVIPTSEKVDPITITSEDERTNFLNSLAENEKGIQNLSKTLEELENSSFLSQSKKISEFRESLMNLNVNLVNSNLNSKEAEQLLNDYDAELYKADKELTKVHYGVGASYLFNGDVFGGNFEKQRVALDMYVRKENVYINASVDYPIKNFMEFNKRKLGYKVGVGYEF